MEKNKMIKYGSVALVLVALIGTKMYLNSTAKSKVDEFIPKTGGALSYDDVSVDLFGLNTRIEGIEFNNNNGELIKVGELVLNDYDDEHDVPQSLDIEINELQVPIGSMDASAKRTFKEMGYGDTLKGSVTLVYNYDEDDKELTIDNYSVKLDDVFSIHLNLELENIDLNQPPMLYLMGAYSTIKLKKAKFSFEDDGFMEKMFSLQAKKQGKDVDDYKKILLSDLDRQIKKTQNALEKDALESAKDFIDDPDEFEISIEPDDAVSIGTIMQIRTPEKAIKLLNIDIDS